MGSTVFYERRKGHKQVEFDQRRILRRSNNEKIHTAEQRRLATLVRRFQREAFRIPVRFRVQEKVFSGYTHDISPEGLLVFTETSLSAGTPIALQFSFGQNVCHLNVSGQIVFCRLAEHGESLQQAIGIKFSAIREFEQKILTSAVQELEQDAIKQEKSLLNILVSTDTLAQEAAGFYNGFLHPESSASINSKNIQTEIERRRSLRYQSNIPVIFEFDGRIDKGFVIELNNDGILLLSPRMLALGSRVAIQISFGGGRSIMKVPAVVVNVRLDDGGDGHNRKIGTAFLSPSEMERKVLEMCVQTLCKELGYDGSDSDSNTFSVHCSTGTQVEILVSNHSNGVRQLGRRRVVVTGLGLVTPIGLGKEPFWDAAIKGVSGVHRIGSFDPSKYPSQVAAEVTAFEAKKYLNDASIEGLDRCVQFGLVAAKMALEDSDLNLELEDKNRIGVSIGSGMGGMIMGERQLTEFYAAGVRPTARPRLIPSVMANALAGQISMRFSIKGPNLTNSTACSSSAHSIGQALNLIRWGMADIVMAGGAEACVSPIIFSGFCSLRALSTHHNATPSKASRPFDKNRDGFVIGEGAGILILESLEHAEARRARIYGEIVGYGATSEAYHMVIPEPQGKEAARTMYLALEDAGLCPIDVDYINAHATSTKVGDIVEAKAIREVFGNRASALPISATKSLIGHTIGAAGAIASITCLLTIKTGFIHPTINLETVDPLCNLGIVYGQAMKKNVKIAMLNAFGFGSNNASLIFSAV
ncbi:MAG: beta-ketoacyl-ACP synthase II [Nitrospirae bacterium]|nr:beta-ketoacyl-ACP synthase II [Nitrospirota bacterium]